MLLALCHYNTSSSHLRPVRGALHVAPQYRTVPGVLQEPIPEEAVTVVRKSFDARKLLKWVYIADVDTAAVTAAGVRNPQRHPLLKDRCLTLTLMS